VAAAAASTGERRRVPKLLVKDVLIGPEKITIRDSIPARASATGVTQRDLSPTRRVTIAQVAKCVGCDLSAMLESIARASLAAVPLSALPPTLGWLMRKECNETTAG